MVRTIRRNYFGVFTVLAAMALLCVLAGSSAAASGSTTLVSVDSSGNQANPGFSGESDMSDEGRYVAFISSSSTLISGDTNTFRDVFVHDRDADEDGVFDEVNEPGAISTEGLAWPATEPKRTLTAPPSPSALMGATWPSSLQPPTSFRATPTANWTFS